MTQQTAECSPPNVSSESQKHSKTPLFLESQLKIWTHDFLQKKFCQCGLWFDSNSSSLSFDNLLHFKRELNFLSAKEHEMYILTLFQEARQPSLLQPVRHQGKDNNRVRLTLKYHVYPFGRVCRSVFRNLYAENLFFLFKSLRISGQWHPHYQNKKWDFLSCPFLLVHYIKSC